MPEDESASSPSSTGLAARDDDRESGSVEASSAERGTTTIASSVVAKIAALAAQEVRGVQAMGKTLSRALGTLRSRVPGGNQASTQGVSVEVGQRQAAVDVDIVAHYGVSLVEVADGIRQNVIARLEAMTGLEVVEVNVAIGDLAFDGGNGAQAGGSRRVQ